MTATEPRRFVGQNIKGTPAMPARKVHHDLRVVRRHSDAFAVQEFKWPWYWTALATVLKTDRWGIWPRARRGLARPISGAQAVGWRRRVWRKRDTAMALLHDGVAKVSDPRWLRAVLLEDPTTGLAAWHGGTHFVVGGDAPTDPPIRRTMMAGDLDALDDFLTRLTRTGHPVIFELDANINRRHASTYREFRELVDERGGRFHGELGIEYLFTIPGREVVVDVQDTWTIPKGDLFTDHEGRGITYRLRTRRQG